MTDVVHNLRVQGIAGTVTSSNLLTSVLTTAVAKIERDQPAVKFNVREWMHNPSGLSRPANELLKNINLLKEADIIVITPDLISQQEVAIISVLHTDNPPSVLIIESRDSHSLVSLVLSEIIHYRQVGHITLKGEQIYSVADIYGQLSDYLYDAVVQFIEARVGTEA